MCCAPDFKMFSQKSHFYHSLSPSTPYFVRSYPLRFRVTQRQQQIHKPHLVVLVLGIMRDSHQQRLLRRPGQVHMMGGWEGEDEQGRGRTGFGPCVFMSQVRYANISKTSLLIENKNKDKKCRTLSSTTEL